MGQLLCTVEDALTIPGRGTVLIPDVITGSAKMGDAIELRLPSGKIIATYVKALESIRRVPPSPPGILLPNDIPTEDVTVGTEVWVI